MNEDELEPEDEQHLSTDESDALERIAKDDADGLIQPAAVVEAARDPESPLHRYFEWDDSAAAHAYRLAQARKLVARYTIRTVEREPERVDAAVSPPTERSIPRFVNAVVNGRRGYVPLDRAAADPDLYRQIVTDARKGIAAYRNRLNAFENARPIVDALDAAITQIDESDSQGEAA